MRIWTFKNQKQYDLLLKQQFLTGDINHIKETWPQFLEAYDWIKKFVPENNNNNNNYPIWAWNKKPDLRKKMFSDYIKSGEYLIELEVPDNLCLISDFSLWHCVLNDMVVCKWNTDASDKLYDLYKKIEVKDKAKYDVLKEKSWERIFNIKYFEF